MLFTHKIPKMLFKNTDYLKLKYFAFALERIFTCVNVFPTALIFLPCYPSNLYELHLPERKTESCHIRFWTKVLMFSPTFLGQSMFLCISYVSPSAYVCVCVSERARASWCCPPEWTPSRGHQLSMQEHCEMTQRQSVWIKTEAVWGGGTKTMKHNADVCIKTWIKTHTLRDDALLSFCTHFHRMTWLSFAAFFDSGFSVIPNRVKSPATQRDTTYSFNLLGAWVAEYINVYSNSWGEELAKKGHKSKVFGLPALCSVY